MSLEDDKIEQQKDLAALIHWFDKGGYANTLRVFSDPLVRGVRGRGMQIFSEGGASHPGADH